MGASAVLTTVLEPDNCEVRMASEVSSRSVLLSCHDGQGKRLVEDEADGWCA